MIRHSRPFTGSALSTLLLAVAAFAAPPDRSAPLVLHESAKHDPPAPSRPLVTSPALPPEALTVRGFTSVQVNVDENGDNIVGDAANEPSIAIDPTDPNNVVIGWRQFDSVNSNFRQSGYGYSHDAGQTWTFPGSLWPGRFGSDPVLGADSDGTFYYMAIGGDDPGVRLFKSFDKGVAWEGPITVNAAFIDKEWFTIDRTGGIGEGHMYLTWSAPKQFTRSLDGGQTWLNLMTIPLDTTVWGTLSVDPDGLLYCCDRGFRVARSSNAQDGNQTPAFEQSVQANLGGSLSFGGPPNPGGLLGQPWVATDHSSGPTRANVYLLCAVNPSNPDPQDIMFTRSTDRGATWSQPVRVNDDSTTNTYQWFGCMAVAPGGRIDVAWYDTRNTGRDTLSELYYAYSTDAGVTWSENVQVGPAFDSVIGHPQQNKIGDYIGAISDAGGMNLAYAATYNGEQDVYFVRIAPDCNANGIHDGDDIASGHSSDVNANGVPDECETDCAAISKFRATCRTGVLRAKVRSTLAEGTILHVDNNGDVLPMTIAADGRGKVRWTGQTGPHTVSITECPDDTRDVACD